MPKKCIICGKNAHFCIKGTSDFYCHECARNNFSDIELLETVEDRAKTLKKMISDSIPEPKDEE